MSGDGENTRPNIDPKRLFNINLKTEIYYHLIYFHHLISAVDPWL